MTPQCSLDEKRQPRRRREAAGSNTAEGLSREWARLGSNQRPLACEASALPLSYAPGRGAQSSRALTRRSRRSPRRRRAAARAAWMRHARGRVALEELGVDLVHALEVVDVGEVDGHAHRVREAAAGRLADGGRGSRGSAAPGRARPPSRARRSTGRAGSGPSRTGGRRSGSPGCRGRWRPVRRRSRSCGGRASLSSSGTGRRLRGRPREGRVRRLRRRRGRRR